ncbi:MerR family transcriptional regulator [Salinisphaera sp. Q1T1-3]|uniref:MerR family transcriptional regulator n=1 Tax=Salinisphaera sp. Q1T1-3 TaxID=2321229 RepID=UPI000E71CF01|nr:MerR family transcriptional regulator [Salinisphaera sp. Q1T1-3]
MSTTSDASLPPIPDKRYFAIGEASALCGVKPHVLRYWEQEFPQLDPPKRRGNRRYYRVADIETARAIRGLLYDEGFTIAGAKARLNGDTPSSSVPAPGLGEQLVAIRCDLERIRDLMDE